jgi:Cytochrome P460
MNRGFLSAVVILCSMLIGNSVGVSGQDMSRPQFTGSNLLRPEGYREWVYLSSGLGMNYNPTAGGPERFTNVFVPQWAYRQFIATGKWPDKTMFALEDRTAESRGSINKSGHFQTNLTGLAVEVKDENRFPEEWAYFGFAEDAKTAEAKPKQQCWQCHNDHAAVEHTFVQFYPTLKPIAQKFGTYRKEAETVTP